MEMSSTGLVSDWARKSYHIVNTFTRTESISGGVNIQAYNLCAVARRSHQAINGLRKIKIKLSLPRKKGVDGFFRMSHYLPFEYIKYAKTGILDETIA